MFAKSGFEHRYNQTFERTNTGPRNWADYTHKFRILRSGAALVLILVLVRVLRLEGIRGLVLLLTLIVRLILLFALVLRRRERIIRLAGRHEG
jgi:uncharacterized protein YqhQ